MIKFASIGDTEFTSVYLDEVEIYTNLPPPLQAVTANGPGLWWDFSDIGTLVKNIPQNLPVTKNGDNVAMVLDKGPNEINGTQPEAVKQLKYKSANKTVNGQTDSVEGLGLTLPAAISNGSMVVDNYLGVHTYSFNLSKSLTLNARSYGFLFTDLENLLITSTELDEIQKNEVEQYFEKRSNVNLSPVTSLNSTWYECNNLTSFPLIDTSNVTSFNNTWYECRNLTSFPLIDTSSGIIFTKAWSDCIGLTSFPVLDTSSGTNFAGAWNACRNLTSFPLLDTSSGTSFIGAWAGCKNLTSFPENAFDNIKGGDFTIAFLDTNLNRASIDNILNSLVVSGISSGKRQFFQSGGSAPSATGKAAIKTLRSRGWTVKVTGGY